MSEERGTPVSEPQNADGVCPVCGDPFVDGMDALEGREGESIEADKVCVEEYPDKAIIHFEEGEVDA